jgi:hypothetical protein
MKNLYFLFIALLAFTFTYAQTRTVTFEDETANWVVGGGSTQTVEADPDDASNSVLKIQYVAGQQWDNWGGIEIPVGADMMKSDQVSFKIKTSDHGDSAGSFGYLFKLEGPSGNIQKPFIVDGSTNWQTITIDYSTCDNQNAAADAGQCQVGNAAGQFTKLVLHHWGGSNPSSPDTEAIYIDDFTHSTGDARCDTQTFPVAFTDTCSSQVAAADGASISFADGYATVSNTNAGDWTNIQFAHDALDLSSGTKGFSVKVKGPRASKVFFKLQVGDNCCSDAIERRPDVNNYTTPGEWQTIVYDMTNESAVNKTKTVIFFDAQMAGSADPADDVFMIDDITFGEFASLSTSKISISDVSIYPNPAKNFVNISAGEKIDSATIFDLTGRIVKISNPNKEVFNFNISDLSNGIYLVKLNAGDKESTIKLIKQ